METVDGKLMHKIPYQPQCSM